jgi:tetratricopeptide (TPR) repeat protein
MYVCACVCVCLCMCVCVCVYVCVCVCVCRSGKGMANGNLGSAYCSLGHFDKAIEHHTQCLAIAKEMGCREEEGKAYGNLGHAYKSMGDLARAIFYHTQFLVMAKEPGDKIGEGHACGNLGGCHMCLNQHDKAVAHYKAYYAIATALEREEQSSTRTAPSAQQSFIVPKRSPQKKSLNSSSSNEDYSWVWMNPAHAQILGLGQMQVSKETRMQVKESYYRSKRALLIWHT